MKTWTVNDADGVNHTIGLKKGLRCKIIVDGEETKVKSSSSLINLIDYLISFGEKECHVVMLGSKMDLAVDGVYLDSKKEYKPINKIPTYSMVLLGISTIGGMILSGIISLVIGVLFGQLYLQKALEDKKNSVIGMFIVCTLIQILYSILIVKMLGR